MREKLILLALILSLLVGEIWAFVFTLPNEFSSTYQYDMDIPWRAGHSASSGYQSGYWGFTYSWDSDASSSAIKPYYNIYSSRIQKVLRGPLIDGGRDVRVTFGQRLDVNYSPFIAHFANDVLGMRISDYEFNLGSSANIKLDGAYILGILPRSPFWEGPEIIGEESNFVVNMNANIVTGGKINTTLFQYYNKSKENSFNNYAIEWSLPFFRKSMILSGVYAGYQEENDWLYTLSGSIEMFPGVLYWETTMLNSSQIDLAAIRGPQSKYLIRPINPLEHDVLEEINFWGKYYNFGPTILFKLGPTQNMLKLDYASTAKKDLFSNSPFQVPENPRIALGLMTVYRKLEFQNTLFRQISDEDQSRSFYRLSILANPSLPINVNASFRFDLDIDSNYTEANPNKVFSLAGVRLYNTYNIWRLKNVELDSFFILSLAGEDYNKADRFKYSLMAKYDAPNRLRIRLQYFSSEDFATQKLDVFGNDKYAPYRWYYNDLQFGRKGIRLIVALPF